MGNCVAGGGYLPVLCDKLLMTEGSGLYLAGPALVKAAIGQTVASEELGGAAMHAASQRHDRFPRTGRRGLPRTAAPSGRLLPRSRHRVIRLPSGRPPRDVAGCSPPCGLARYTTSRDLLPGIRSATSARCILDATLRRIQGGIWPNAGVRLRPAGRRAGRRGGQSAPALPAGRRPVAVRRRHLRR